VTWALSLLGIGNLWHLLPWFLGALGAGGVGIGGGSLLFGWPAVLAFLATLWKWLTHRTTWQLVSMALACAFVAQRLSLVSEKRHSEKLQTQVTNLSVQLQRISEARNTQRVRTGDNIKSAKQKINEVQVVKEHIIKAPNPSNCATPALEESRAAL
jgi:glycerol-3-phosphate acyltransferase PlsY